MRFYLILIVLIVESKLFNAGMAELVDARDSKSRDVRIMSVRVRLPAPSFDSKNKEILVAADCIFCKIIARELPAKIVAENDSVIVIQDIHPKAPTHLLIIPKKHLADLRDVRIDRCGYVGRYAFNGPGSFKNVATPGAFNLLFNNGPEAGQRVFHMHAHFLAGKKMVDF